MGLDMYLSARLYLSEYGGPTGLLEPVKQAILGVPGIFIPERHPDAMDNIQIEVPVMYWRKFNALHGWFVREVQDGKDECQDSHVDTDKLRELDKLVSELFMARNPALVLEKMPPTQGFFFGGTEIDDWFWEKMRTTMEATHGLLAGVDSGALTGWEFYYTASW